MIIEDVAIASAAKLLELLFDLLVCALWCVVRSHSHPWKDGSILHRFSGLTALPTRS